MTTKLHVSLTINGKKVEADIPAAMTLAEFLHEELGLTGTKVCCGMAICKACTVAIRPAGEQRISRVQSCIMPVVGLNNHEILTVEGLAQGGELHPLQQAFLKHFSFQCGYCAPGFLLGATLLMDQLKAAPIPKAEVDATIAGSLGDHVCRCSGYVKYYAAIREVILATPGLTV